MKKTLLATLLCLLASTVYSDEMVTTKSGKKINLKDDGTWALVETKAANSSNADSAIAVVDAYLSVDEYDDRLKYILDPERIRPLRDEQNVGRSAYQKPTYKIVTKKEPQNIKVGEWVKVEASIKREDNQWKNVIYYLNKTNSGYKIDWESSTGYNKISATEFQATKPTAPVRVRVLAQLDNYYNYEFMRSQTTMHSVSMVDNDQFQYGHGYIRKNSEIGEKVFKALKNGGWHYMVFDIKSLENGRDGSHFLVDDVVSVDSWLVK